MTKTTTKTTVDPQAAKAVAERKASRTRKATTKPASTTKPDVAADPQPTPTADPQPTATPDAPKPAENRVDRVRLAQDEDKALKAALKAGQPVPATPNLDAIKKEHEMNNRPQSARSRSRTAKKTAEAVPPPAAKRGFSNIPLRSDKHVVVIKAALKGSKLESAVEGLWLVAKNSEAPQLVKLIGEYATANRKVIYDARLAVATLVMLRHEFPNAKDEKPGVTSKLIDGLNAAKAEGKIDDWSVTIKLDGTLSWSWSKGGKDHEAGARDLAGKFAA